MTGGALIFTCPLCRAIVDYSCLCDEQPTISQYVGHATVGEAKAHIIALKEQPSSKQARSAS